MTDDELAAAGEAIQELREDVRADLAEDLGGDPDDYCADHYFASPDDQEDDGEAVPDGGDQ